MANQTGQAADDAKSAKSFSLLEHMDVFREPVAHLTHNGEKSKKTAKGGLVTLVTIVLFIIGFSVKVSSEISKYSAESI